ncbi:unnamed protein product [Penicillium olsonii]|uniref:Major facilitator superfamily (MFS) profile domain-containing protein n=1 Tax=Penicillium olsonii TaxID=99116 RepID=A0A9W4HF42_PENOL|nr:unnamed protein product [Penicillium olsonii]CAG8149993.1 unnamed protein product [Penicillium olsonii]
MQDIELQRRGSPREDDSSPRGRENLALPPTDRGKDAWLTLAACCVLEALVWGFPFSFGVFQEYYDRQEAFAREKSTIAAIGTTATGLMYCTAPFIYDLLRRFPAHRKMLSVMGYIVLLASIIGASFARTASHLLATQGILYALGGSLHYFPAYIYLDEWFVQRKGLAYGIFIAGAGIAGIVTPFAMSWILNKWGFRTALRTWAVVSFAFTSPALVFMKERVPHHQTPQGPTKLNLRFFKSPALWILLLGNVIQSLGFFIPTFYMPSFAASQGWSTLSGTVAIALFSAANVVGATLMGWLVDRYHVTFALNICAVGTVMAIFLFWSFAVYKPIFYIFACLYGVFAGGFPATWSGCSDVVRRRYRVETGMIIALFTAGKGIGSVVSGPVGSSLVASDTWKNQAGFSYGTGYGYLFVFCGVTASFTAIGWVGKKCGLV